MIVAAQSTALSHVRPPRVEHRFSGPPYTLGIEEEEEELMILDAASLELLNPIESPLEPAPSGEIKLELTGVGAGGVHRPVPEYGQGGRSRHSGSWPGRS
jgi:hypothetical protein